MLPMLLGGLIYITRAKAFLLNPRGGSIEALSPYRTTKGSPRIENFSIFLLNLFRIIIELIRNEFPEPRYFLLINSQYYSRKSDNNYYGNYS